MVRKYHKSSNKARYMDSKEGHSGRRESEGMDKYWHENRNGGADKAHKEMYKDNPHKMPRHEGSSNHGDGSVGGHRKDPGYSSGRIEPSYVAQYQESWGCGCGNSMRQYENGSMDYLSDKNEIRDEDDRRVSGQMMPQ